jgi:Domain of unknown function (DUF4166)
MRAQIASEPRANTDADPVLGDLRFRALMTEEAWSELPLPIRNRFSKRLAGGKTIVYVGEILETRMSHLGRLLANATRLIGSPFPTACDAGVPSVVTVTEDMRNGGQIWTRLYARTNGFPQVIHSSKRFAGSSGLEEYVGRGVGMALTVHVEQCSLVFRSHHYFLELLGRRMRLPTWLSPGNLSVTHAERGDGSFSFILDVSHPAFGALIRQHAAFREIAP